MKKWIAIMPVCWPVCWPVWWAALSIVLLAHVGPVAPGARAAKLGIGSFPLDLAQEIRLPAGGVAVYLVYPHSPASRMGLQPGDVITALDGQAVQGFAQLADIVGNAASGKTVSIVYRREGKALDAKVTLSSSVGEADANSYRACLNYLASLRARFDGPALRRELIDCLLFLGQRREAGAEIDRSLARYPRDVGLKTKWLEQLHKSGQYHHYVTEALALADQFPKEGELQAHKLEALLAVGRLSEVMELAPKVVTSHLSFPGILAETGQRALTAWTAAKMRAGQSLRHPQLDQVFRAVHSSREAAPMQYWREQLAARAPYRLTKSGAPGELKLDKASVFMGIIPHKMHGIEIEINGVKVPMAIIDTGASHTLLNVAIAQKAKVAIGSATRSASGSLAFTARPGFVNTIKIGEFVLHDVPVSVGNPPPLVVTKAQVALGVDVMQHLRFIIDYPRGKVLVQSAHTPPDPPVHPESVWDIPLWTFADHTLSQAQLEDGTFARTLIDSGNFAQTLIWPTWAKEAVPGHPGAASSLFAFAFSNPEKRNYYLQGVRLGGRTLPNWPAMDMPPFTLQGVDLLDILMGHDLLSQYRVTIDLRQRRLRLESPSEKFKEPVPQLPINF